MKKTLSCLWIILTLVGLAGCSPDAATPAATIQPSTPIEEQSTALPAEKPLPPEPQVVTIPSANGIQLEGRYYPGASNPSPLVVLMHWAPGDQHVWDSLAPWLQNRG
ncbi:MAG: hypothetical protein HGA86_06450, partial [Anaerolineaceae bacterium]|nr:hypothetical protein [Anaerolineaceae bacterium]